MVTSPLHVAMTILGKVLRQRQAEACEQTGEWPSYPARVHLLGLMGRLGIWIHARRARFCDEIILQREPAHLVRPVMGGASSTLECLAARMRMKRRE